MYCTSTASGMSRVEHLSFRLVRPNRSKVYFVTSFDAKVRNSNVTLTILPLDLPWQMVSLCSFISGANLLGSSNSLLLLNLWPMRYLPAC